MNMIDKDAVLHMIGINIEPHAHGEWDSGYNVALSEIREKIKQMPTIEAEPDKGWVSVDDRLPELYENVLTIDSDGKIFINWLEEITETKSYFAYGSESVTHWQYLPEPPKGE